MSLAHKLLCRITGSSGNPGTDNSVSAKSEMASPSKEGIKKQETAVKGFVAEDPQSRYTFDSVERDAPECEICREGDKLSRKCIQIHMHSTQLFKTMQDLGFYCALPMDPSRTYMECQRIPK